MEKHKECKCGADAKWEWADCDYCETCARVELDVTYTDAPRVCAMCGNPIDRMYYTDRESAFCSAKCALEYNGAFEIEEEQEDDE